MNQLKLKKTWTAFEASEYLPNRFCRLEKNAWIVDEEKLKAIEKSNEFLKGMYSSYLEFREELKNILLDDVGEFVYNKKTKGFLDKNKMKLYCVNEQKQVGVPYKSNETTHEVRICFD